jgi:hypothetical protein
VVLFGLQASVARLRRTSRLDRMVDNQPLLSMDGATILDDHLDAVRLTARTWPSRHDQLGEQLAREQDPDDVADQGQRGLHVTRRRPDRRGRCDGTTRRSVEVLPGRRGGSASLPGRRRLPTRPDDARVARG